MRDRSVEDRLRIWKRCRLWGIVVPLLGLTVGPLLLMRQGWALMLSGFEGEESLGNSDTFLTVLGVTATGLGVVLAVLALILLVVSLVKIGRLKKELQEGGEE